MESPIVPVPSITKKPPTDPAEGLLPINSGVGSIVKEHGLVVVTTPPDAAPNSTGFLESTVNLPVPKVTPASLKYIVVFIVDALADIAYAAPS